MIRSSVDNDETDPQHYNDAMRRKNASDWKEAIRNEYDSLVKNMTWDVVDASDLPPSAKPLTSRYVFKRKTLFDHGTDTYKYKYKARLVARGFL
jgi:hypothetical protein